MGHWSLERGFHKPMEISKIYHRCIQIGRRLLETYRHRLTDIGAVLAADYRSYFMIGRQEKWPFGKKVQYNILTNIITR